MAEKLTYHNDPAVKTRALAEMRRHREEDRLVQGEYWDDEHELGCAVGCLSHDPDGGHGVLERAYGLPETSTYLEDAIFEGLPKDESAGWPERFLSAMPVGVPFRGIDRASYRVTAWMLSTDGPMGTLANTAEIMTVSRLYERAGAGYEVTQGEWAAAMAAASAVASAAAWAAIADRLVSEIESTDTNTNGADDD